MGISYGRSSLRVTSDDVNSITNTNGTIVSQGNDSYGGFQITWYPLNGGCGVTPNSFFKVELKDPIPWTNITYELYTTAYSACWNFNQGGQNGTGNLATFNSSLDRTFNTKNSFELPQYQIKMNACDNEPTNFMHNSFKTGTFRSFFVTRRRSVTTSLANINVELSCNGTGASQLYTIRNIFVW